LGVPYCPLPYSTSAFKVNIKGLYWKCVFYTVFPGAVKIKFTFEYRSNTDLHELLDLEEGGSLLVLQGVAPDELPGEGGEHLPQAPQLLCGVLLKLVLRHFSLPGKISLNRIKYSYGYNRMDLDLAPKTEPRLV
jgi:hypothetical protein